VDAPPGFAEFVGDNSRTLLRTAKLLTGDWAAAEDLVQTALAKTWPRWHRIVAREAALSYVRRTLVTTYLADRRRRWTGEISTDRLPEVAGPHDVFAEADERHVLLAAVASLPPRQRAVIVLRFFEDLTEAATADALGCSVGTVKSYTVRALRALQATPGLNDGVSAVMQ
jgi:RNA polymerase sigma-70 factor (sigma-E family)